MLKVDDFLFVITGDPSKDQDSVVQLEVPMSRALNKCISVNLHDRKPTNFTKYLESKQVPYGLGGIMFSKSRPFIKHWKCRAMEGCGKETSKNSPAELLLGIGLLDMENLHTHSMVFNFMQRFQGVMSCCLLFDVSWLCPVFRSNLIDEVKFDGHRRACKW